MSWSVWQVLLRLRSPLHVGWRRAGNCWQCRPYLPAYPLLCALAARLTESGLRWCGGEDPYSANLNWLKDHVRLTYFFPALVMRESGDLLEIAVFVPCYDEGGNLLFYQQLQTMERTITKNSACGTQCQEWLASEFDYLFLDAQARTALTQPDRVAQTGALYHCEFLRPHTRDHEAFASRPVYLTGYVVLDGEAKSKLLQPDVGRSEEHVWRLLFDRLQVGGERRLGWGLLTLQKWAEVQAGSELLGLNGLGLRLNQGVEIYVSENRPVLGHAITGQVQLCGPVEILFRRETCVVGGVPRSGFRITVPGQENGSIAAPRPYYLPGSLTGGTAQFLLTPDGLWQASPN